MAVTESAPDAAERGGHRFQTVGSWLVVCCYLAGAVAVTARLWAWRWRHWPRGALTSVAVLAVVPLIPLAYRAVPLPPVPAGWQTAFARLSLPPDAPVLVLPFPSALQTDVMYWQADTGQPGALIGGYFIGPGASPRAPIAHLLTKILGQPACDIGAVLSWSLRR
ncbi:MAG: hypothetical protein ACRDNF_16925 [Streptosporangiaceae bacterium]